MVFALLAGLVTLVVVQIVVYWRQIDTLPKYRWTREFYLWKAFWSRRALIHLGIAITLQCVSVALVLLAVSPSKCPRAAQMTLAFGIAPLGMAALRATAGRVLSDDLLKSLRSTTSFVSERYVDVLLSEAKNIQRDDIFEMQHSTGYWDGLPEWKFLRRAVRMLVESRIVEIASIGGTPRSLAIMGNGTTPESALYLLFMTTTRSELRRDLLTLCRQATNGGPRRLEWGSWDGSERRVERASRDRRDGWERDGVPADQLPAREKRVWNDDELCMRIEQHACTDSDLVPRWGMDPARVRRSTGLDRRIVSNARPQRSATQDAEVQGGE